MELRGLIDSLKSSDPLVHGAALERALFGSLEVDPETLDVRRLARAYRRLSDDVLRVTSEAGRSTGALRTTSDRDADLIWGLVYGARTFHVAHRLLAKHDDAQGALLDIGGGWGPAALWAALNGRPAYVIEADALRRSLGLRLTQALGLEVHYLPRLAALRDDVKPSTVVWAYSLREMHSSPEQAAGAVLDALRRWQTPTKVMVFESGARTGSEFLMAVRDQLVELKVPISAPCSATGPCPARAASDWCHFTWNAPLGPVGQRIASSAGRNGHELHLSWILAERQTSPSLGHRLLSVRLLGKQGARLSLCTNSGLRRVDVPRKFMRSIPWLKRGVSGAVLDIGSETDERISSLDDIVLIDE